MEKQTVKAKSNVNIPKSKRSVDIPKYAKVTKTNAHRVKDKITKLLSDFGNLDTNKAHVSFLLTFRNRFWTVVTLGRTRAEAFIDKMDRLFTDYDLARAQQNVSKQNECTLKLISILRDYGLTRFIYFIELMGLPMVRSNTLTSYITLYYLPGKNIVYQNAIEIAHTQRKLVYHNNIDMIYSYFIKPNAISSKRVVIERYPKGIVHDKGKGKYGHIRFANVAIEHVHGKYPLSLTYDEIKEGNKTFTVLEPYKGRYTVWVGSPIFEFDKENAWSKGKESYIMDYWMGNANDYIDKARESKLKGIMGEYRKVNVKLSRLFSVY